MMQRLGIVPPLLVAASGIVVAQLHGGPFWVWVFGVPWLGWLVSATWEAASIWLWWRGAAGGAAAFWRWVATLALIAGMSGASARPMLLALGEAEAGAAHLEILQGQSAHGFWVSPRAVAGALDALALPGAWLEWAPAATVVGLVLLMPTLYGLALYCVATAGAHWRTPPHPAGTPPRTQGGEGWQPPASYRRMAQRLGLRIVHPGGVVDGARAAQAAAPGAAQAAQGLEQGWLPHLHAAAAEHGAKAIEAMAGRLVRMQDVIQAEQAGGASLSEIGRTRGLRHSAIARLLAFGQPGNDNPSPELIAKQAQRFGLEDAE